MSKHSSSTPELCEICRPLEVAKYFLPPLDGEAHTRTVIGDILFKSKELGTRKEIARRSSHCSFCILVYAATRQVGDEAVITISSVLCGQNRTASQANEAPAYYIQVSAMFRGVQFITRIQLLADDASSLGLSRDFRAREPSLKGVDIQQVRAWLNLCHNRHGELCKTLGGEDAGTLALQQPHDLLAIDLVSMCICNMPLGADYTALSYCWPSKAYLTLVQKNRKDLFEHSALVDHMGELPGTVQDSIQLAKELPYRYLWIDALCIVQDDPTHKTVQLRQMDLVYSCAEVTLVCAYPVAPNTGDSCSGFPGYNKADSARTRDVQQVDGLRLMVTSLSVDDCLMSTRWSTRCWTYQEGLLSRRLLSFTPTQVYFQCSQGLFCEDVDCENISSNAHVRPGSTLFNLKAQNMGEEANNWGNWTLSRKPIDTLQNMLKEYEIALSNYTYREVSYASDILKAFEGIKAILCDSMQTDFWQGIPEKLLPQALCWQIRGRHLRRMEKPDGKKSPKPLFPTWTWAAYDSSVNLNDHMPIEEYRTDVEFYIINDAGFATRLDVQPQWMTISRHRPSSALLKAFLPNLVPREEVDASSDAWRDARILGCWTTSASFYLDGSHHRLGYDSHEKIWTQSTNFAIKDPWGATAGCILLPDDFFQSARVDGMMCEFILISRGRKRHFEGHEMTYFDESIYMTDWWCHLNVMMISRIGEMTAVRVGVGIINKQAWGAAAPETTFIKLV